MRTTFRKITGAWKAATTACLFIASTVALAAEPRASTPAGAAVPGELVDEAFTTDVDLAEVRANLVSLDAARLTDQALALSVAEQRVGRKHKSIAAGDLLHTAARVARETGDRATLNRLGEIAAQRDDSSLAALASLPRDATRMLGRVDPDLGVPLSELSAESVVLFRAYRNQILLAKAVNDRGALDQLTRGIGLLPELHPAQRDFLLALIEEVRVALRDRTSAATQGIARLAASALSQ